jgi:hypothetical protein
MGLFFVPIDSKGVLGFDCFLTHPYFYFLSQLIAASACAAKRLGERPRSRKRPTLEDTHQSPGFN